MRIFSGKRTATVQLVGKILLIARSRAVTPCLTVIRLFFLLLLYMTRFHGSSKMASGDSYHMLFQIVLNLLHRLWHLSHLGMGCPRVASTSLLHV